MIHRYPDHIATRHYTRILAHLGPLEKRSGHVPKFLGLRSSAPLDAVIPQDEFLVLRYHPEGRFLF